MNEIVEINYTDIYALYDGNFDPFRMHLFLNMVLQREIKNSPSLNPKFKKYIIDSIKYTYYQIGDESETKLKNIIIPKYYQELMDFIANSKKKLSIKDTTTCSRERDLSIFEFHITIIIRKYKNEIINETTAYIKEDDIEKIVVDNSDEDDDEDDDDDDDEDKTKFSVFSYFIYGVYNRVFLNLNQLPLLTNNDKNE